MPPILTEGDAKAGTIGGTVLAVFLNIQTEAILATALHALVGATVSFIASVLLRFILKRFNRK